MPNFVYYDIHNNIISLNPFHDADKSSCLGKKISCPLETEEDVPSDLDHQTEALLNPILIATVKLLPTKMQMDNDDCHLMIMEKVVNVLSRSSYVDQNIDEPS